ncbi:hypothetical protein ACKKBG_A26290 [Auxenochlorella protothecoides x Auxenochlorella symbiontica]
MSSVTPLEHTAIGGVAGFTETCIMQPTIAIKNALQEGRPIPRSPMTLYRGLAVNSAATFPITATQFGVNRLLESLHQQHLGYNPTGISTIGIALSAGASSAFIGCPAEFLMIQQQKSGLSLATQLKSVAGSFGVLKIYKGLAATMMRESLYTAGYLGVAPLLKAKLTGHSAFEGTPGAALVVSGVSAGILATLTSHPADTIKTRMQAHPDNTAFPHYSSVASTARHIVAAEGYGGFFAGVLPRTFRLIGAVFILTGIRGTLVDAIEDARYAGSKAASQ